MSKGKSEITQFNSSLPVSSPNGRARGRHMLTTLAVGALFLCAPAVCQRVHADTSGFGDGIAAPAAPSQGPLIDLDVVNANLLSVVKVLQLQSKAQMVVVSGSYQPVTLTVTASLQDALRYVAQSAGATVTRDANGVYTFRPASASDNGMSSGMDDNSLRQAPVAAPPVSAPIPLQSLHSERIQLQNVDPNYILIMLNDPTGIRYADPSRNPINDSPMARPYSPPMITPGSGMIQEYNNNSQQPSVPMNGDVYSGGAASQANRANNRGDQASQFGGGIFQPGQVYPGGGGNIVNPFQNNPLQPTNPNLGGNAGGQGGNLRPQGIDSIIANEQDNSIIVRGTPEGIAELKQIIGFLDRAPKQVQIKLEYITTNVADADSFGINWDLIPYPNMEASFNGGGITGALGSTVLTYAQGNLVAHMQAILSNSRGKLVNSSIITTTNNTPASINFSSSIPYATTTTVAQGNGNAIQGNQVNFLTIPNTLTVTPRINGDNSVSLLLNPQLSTTTPPSFAGAPPTVTTQIVTTYRTVANGETMVIGGLVTKNTTNTSNEVPFLSKLPIIGSLFRTRNFNTSDSELLIFVTPTVLPPIGSGSVGNPVLGGGPATGGTGIGVTP